MEIWVRDVETKKGSLVLLEMMGLVFLGQAEGRSLALETAVRALEIEYLIAEAE